jgi:hypothetical protein
MLLFDVPPEVEKAVSMLSILLGAAGPFLIIFSSNLLIIITILKAKKDRTKLVSSQMDNSSDSRRLTVMLVFVSLAYLVTSLPYRLYDPIMEIPALADIYDMTRHYWRLRSGIGMLVVANLWFCNYAVNFYLYCIGGGGRYRNDAKYVLRALISCGLNVKY